MRCTHAPPVWCVGNHERFTIYRRLPHSRHFYRSKFEVDRSLAEQSGDHIRNRALDVFAAAAVGSRDPIFGVIRSYGAAWQEPGWKGLRGGQAEQNLIAE